MDGLAGLAILAFNAWAVVLYSRMAHPNFAVFAIVCVIAVLAAPLWFFCGLIIVGRYYWQQHKLNRQ